MCVCMCVYIYTTEYYSTLRKKEILLFVRALMELEGIMLSAISQTETNKYHIVLSIHGTKKNVKLVATKRRKVVTRGQGK